MSFTLMDLPYSKDALAPHISAETMEYHYGKHHNKYVNTLNTLLEGSDLKGKSLEEIIRNSEGGMFNNAAQVFNHNFYWMSLSPNGGGEATGAVADAINDAFGSFADFKEKFTKAAATNFGSGWTWLVKKNGKLEIVNTSNAHSAIEDESAQPIITCDVWEHAYYVDYRNARPDYINAFWNLVNWDFANENFAK